MAKMRYQRIGAFMFWGAYQLVDDFEIQTNIKGYTVDCKFYKLSPDGKLLIKKYFVWDGPSGAIKTRTFVAGSCVHDVFCNMINDGFLPKALQCMADEEMYNINVTQGMWKLRRAWTYRAVRGYQLKKKKIFKSKVYGVEIPDYADAA